MAEYIEREAFLKDAETRYCLPCKGAGKDYNGVKCRACWVDDMMGDVDDAPAADCSACGEDFYIEQIGDPVKDLFTYTYCPNCGARMDEGAKNGKTDV